MDEKKLTFTEHLDELRTRLIYAAIPVVVLFFVLFFTAAKPIFKILMAPILDSLPPEYRHLNFTSPFEVFMTDMKVAGLAALFISIPWIFYQFWQFISPGLYDKERSYIVPFSACSSIFFIFGALFGYFVMFPYGFKYMMSISVSPEIAPLLSVKEYFTLSTLLLLGFGVVFELPLLMVLFARIGLVSEAMLKKTRKYAILLCFIIGAILTPPDVVSQFMMSVPMVLLYEIGIIGVRLFGPKKRLSEDLPG
jgi:sec-independent protein translocase protein TatC